MKPILAWTERPAMIVPSMTECGSCSKMRRSLQVPGSDSSPLTRTYFGFADCFGHERPLEAGGEACAAAAAQVRGFHLVDDAFGAQREGLARGLVAAQLDVAVDVRRALAEAVGDDGDAVGMGGERRHYFSRPAFGFSAVVVEDLVHGFGRQVLVEVVIDLRSRGPGAGADALDFFQRKKAVGSDAFVGDAELLLAMVEDFVAAAQHAADIGADLDVVFAGGFGAQQGVVADHVADIELGDADALGDLGDDRVGEIADLVLRVEQHGDEGGALHGVEGDELVEASGERGREEGGHCFSALRRLLRAVRDGGR